jgi:aldose 1-epimerase
LIVARQAEPESPAPTAPSGVQIEIRHGDQAVTVVEVGAGLRTYTVGGRDVLDGYAVEELCPSGRGQVLIPWPNRLAGGHYTFDGRSYQLPVSEPDRDDAIHGLVRWEAWTIAEAARDRVVLSHLLEPQPGYPFPLSLLIAYRLSDAGLEVTTTSRNVGSVACPYGAGQHPYLTLGTPSVDSLALRVPARTVLRHDGRGVPTGEMPVDGTPFDLRQGRLVGDSRFDDFFADFDRDPDGLARVRLDDRAGDRHAIVWFDRAYRYATVFTGDALPDVARRSIAIEPMTCPPNAFSTGRDLVRLEPGETHEGRWGIDPFGGLGNPHPPGEGATR